MEIYPRRLNRSYGAPITKGDYQFDWSNAARTPSLLHLYRKKIHFDGRSPGNWEEKLASA